MTPDPVKPEDVEKKLRQLHIKHEKLGNANRAIGVDTLAMLFNLNFDEMIRILNDMASEGKVLVTFRTTDHNKTGKNKVAFVNLLLQ